MKSSFEENVESPVVYSCYCWQGSWCCVGSLSQCRAVPTKPGPRLSWVIWRSMPCPGSWRASPASHRSKHFNTQSSPHSLPLIFSPGRCHCLFLLNVRDNGLHDLWLGNISPGSPAISLPTHYNLQVVSFVRERPQKVSITPDIEQSLEYPTITICSPAFFSKTRWF